uniref:Uncharacterized protein n=1 Tax=Anguilla anguilla TaxID=7936 RepID=A0A0E9RXV1_ANGAN
MILCNAYQDRALSNQMEDSFRNCFFSVTQ